MKKHFKIILFYGIFWGLIEFVLGGYLHYLNVPLTNFITGIIGSIILIICAIKYKSPICLIGIGLIAAFFKIFNIFTCDIPFNSSGIIIPIISILILSLIATIITFTLNKIDNIQSLKIKKEN